MNYWAGLSRIDQLRKLAFTKQLVWGYSRKALPYKIGINLGGQLFTNKLKGEMKFDAAGFVTDAIGSNLMASVVGGVGEAGFDFSKGTIYTEHNLTEEKRGLGAMKFIVGYGIGELGGPASKVIGSNFFSKLVDPMLKVFEETSNYTLEKANEPIYPDSLRNAKK